MVVHIRINLGVLIVVAMILMPVALGIGFICAFIPSAVALRITAVCYGYALICLAAWLFASTVYTKALADRVTAILPFAGLGHMAHAMDAGQPGD